MVAGGEDESGSGAGVTVSEGEAEAAGASADEDDLAWAAGCGPGQESVGGCCSDDAGENRSGMEGDSGLLHGLTHWMLEFRVECFAVVRRTRDNNDTLLQRIGTMRGIVWDEGKNAIKPSLASGIIPGSERDFFGALLATVADRRHLVEKDCFACGVEDSVSLKDRQDYAKAS